VASDALSRRVAEVVAPPQELLGLAEAARLIVAVRATQEAGFPCKSWIKPTSGIVGQSTAAPISLG
jgi:hypothetical protein